MSKFFSFLIVFLFININLVAQFPGYTEFNINHGLPSNTVYDIIQDENGFILLATDYGLSRFDGISFKNYTISDGLPDNEILYLFKDSTNRIWLIGFNGKVGYYQNEKIYSFKNKPFLSKIHSTSFIVDVFEDSKRNIWFMESLNNIKKLDPFNNISIFKLPNLDKDRHSKKMLFIEDLNGQVNILASTVDKNNANELQHTVVANPKWKVLNFNLFDNKTILHLRHKIPEAVKHIDPISNQFSNSIFNDLKYSLTNNLLYQTLSIGNYYLVTNLNEGVLQLNSKDKFQFNKLLPTIHSTKSFLDDENNIWIGSQSNGIFLFPNLHVKGAQFEDFMRNDLFSVIKFENKIILGNGKSEIIILDAESLDMVKSYKLATSLSRVRQIKFYNKHLYITDDIGVSKMNTDFSFEKIKSMYDTDFELLKLKNFKNLCVTDTHIFTANSNGVVKIDKTTKKIEQLWDKRSASICISGKDSIWIGTTNGLYLNYKKATNKFNLSEEFNNSNIYAIENGLHGLLIGSNSHGLGILKNGNFKKINTKDGLLSDYVKSIFIDSKNKIWVSTNFGLNCVELDQNSNIKNIKSFTTSDGLYSNDVRSCFVENEKVYVATSKGLNIIDLSKETTSILKPRTHINEILLNNALIEKKSNQTFKYNLNNIQFNFSGISFKSLGSISFKYRLVGLEEEWITTKSNTIRYSELPPNTYTFELIAISKNNLESLKPASFTFTIKPPFYKTWWFTNFMLLVLISTIIYIVFREKMKFKKEQNLKEKISNLRYQALNAQMNPHFINNLLVNIDGLLTTGHFKEVKDGLGKFAELVNYILESTKSNLISLNDEIKMATLYLELQKLRFNNNISYTINTQAISEEDLDDILVPPMILQPIIENSFKHGFKNNTKNNSVELSFKIENDEYVLCKIVDNGIGSKSLKEDSHSKDSGISISNINERLQLIDDSKNKENLVLVSNVTDEFNNFVGLQVILKIPLITY